MVWGLSMPSSFGDYFPHGDYVGWDEELKRYYDETMPAEQKAPFLVRGPVRYFRYVGAKFRKECGSNDINDLPPITPIKAHEPPKWYETVKTYSSLGSLIELPNQILAVDDALKSIIERLEPEVHQFFPIQITMPKGAVYPKRYFVMAIGRYFDSFSKEKSKVGCWKDRGNGYYSALYNLKEHLTGLAFSKTVFGNAHLWRERHMSEPEILFSDELQAEITKAGLRLPKHYQMKAV